MFSTSTMASSTSMPTTSVSASMVSVFIVKPKVCRAQNVGMTASGRAAAEISVARMSLRNSQTTMMARIPPSSSMIIELRKLWRISLSAMLLISVIWICG